jgi:hypothetical protein
VVINHITDYSGWTQYSNVNEGTGHIAFHHRDSTKETIFQLKLHNGLWYNHAVGFADVPTCRITTNTEDNPTSTIRYMSKAAEFALLHCRSGHACDDTTSELYKHLDDCPRVTKHAFWKCPTCMQEKAKEPSFPSAAGQRKLIKMPPISLHTLPLHCQTIEVTNKDDTKSPQETKLQNPEVDDLQPGQTFHMDFGFMRGSGFSEKDEDGRIITNLDGMNSYLIIVDRKTRCMWVFLTKSKIPPIKIVTEFLALNGSRTATHRTVRSNQGGELWKSTTF